MRRFPAVLSLFALFVSCEEETPDAPEEPRSGKAGTQFYYVEFIDKDSSTDSRRSIQFAKRLLLNHGCYYTAEPRGQNHLQGALLTDSIDLSVMDGHFPEIHHFRDISEYDPSDKAAVKIVITYNKPLGDTLPNFDFRGYEKLGHAEWQPVHNPGNFCYHHHPKDMPEKEIGPWMWETIVLLTFK